MQKASSLFCTTNEIANDLSNLLKKEGIKMLQQQISNSRDYQAMLNQIMILTKHKKWINFSVIHRTLYSGKFGVRFDLKFIGHDQEVNLPDGDKHFAESATWLITRSVDGIVNNFTTVTCTADEIHIWTN